MSGDLNETCLGGHLGFQFRKDFIKSEFILTTRNMDGSDMVETKNPCTPYIN